MGSFLDRVAIPTGHFDNDILGAVGDALASQTRLQGQAGRLLQLVQFFVGGFVAGRQTFPNYDVTSGAGADSAAGVFERNIPAIANVKDRAGLPAAAVGD